MIAAQNLDLQDQVAENANAAFRRVQPKVMVGMPVATHEETDYVYDALMSYAKPGRVQRAIILSCNAPKGVNADIIDATMGEVERFSHYNPEVPLSFFETSYGPGTTIGEIRHDVVGVGIGALADKYGVEIPRDTLLVNADADTTQTPENYTDELHAAASLQFFPEFSFVYPGLRNTTSNGRYPNMDMVMGWTDFYAVHGGKYSDGNNALGLGTYIAARGFDARCSYGETTELLARARAELGEALSEIYIGPRAVTVSGRHAYHQMSEGQLPHFEPIRSERTDYRSEIRGAVDIGFGRANSEIDMLSMAETSQVIASYAQRFADRGYQTKEAFARALTYTNVLMDQTAKRLRTSPQLVKAWHHRAERITRRQLNQAA